MWRLQTWSKAGLETLRCFSTTIGFIPACPPSLCFQKIIHLDREMADPARVDGYEAIGRAAHDERGQSPDYRFEEAGHAAGGTPEQRYRCEE